MSDITPSTKLKCVTVHKLQDTSCLRKYFWNRVLNLESRKVNLNFHYGSVLHAGFETLLMTHNISKALFALTTESKKRQKRYTITTEDLDELDLQVQIIQLFIKAASIQPWVNRLKMLWTERQFRCQVADTGVTFCSQVDGGGSAGKDDALFEIKTAKSVNNSYFEALSFDHQIHGYGYQMQQEHQRFPSKCAFCVFRKPSKYIKKGQSREAFVQEIKTDLVKRPEWYFIADPQTHQFPYMLTMGRNTIEQAGKDIVRATQILLKQYQCPEKDILDPYHWPCNDKQCLNYGACTYLPLCRNMAKWQLYTRLYQQREFMYDEEKAELQI
ncbi:MAG: hypothetical protein PHF37_05810 [Phycisphaerae bacterium]|nr:hypothetical protein [Phycisphaerae bacterium]